MTTEAMKALRKRMVKNARETFRGQKRRRNGTAAQYSQPKARAERMSRDSSSPRE